MGFLVKVSVIGKDQEQSDIQAGFNPVYQKINDTFLFAFFG